MTEEVQDQEPDYQDVLELEHEFSDLRDKKRKDLQSQKSKHTKSENKDLAIVGSVENIDKIRKSSKVRVTVKYSLDGETKEKSFMLERPESKEEFSTDNEFVRMINFFGEKNGNPSGLMHRDVWLKIRNGDDVELHIPSSLRKTEVKKQKLKRKKVKSGIAGWGEPIGSELARSSIAGGISSSGAALGLTGMISKLGLGFALMNILLSSLIAIIVSVIAVVLIAGSSSSNKNSTRTFVAIFLLGSLITCTLAFFGLAGMSVPPQVAGDFQSTGNNALVGTAICMLIIISMLFLSDPFKYTVKNASKLKGKIKNWYNKKRGIEYVK